MIGLGCTFGSHLRNYSLNGTFTLRVFLSNEGKGNQYRLLALGDSFLLGRFLG